VIGLELLPIVSTDYILLKIVVVAVLVLMDVYTKLEKHV